MDVAIVAIEMIQSCNPEQGRTGNKIDGYRTYTLKTVIVLIITLFSIFETRHWLLIRKQRLLERGGGPHHSTTTIRSGGCYGNMLKSNPLSTLLCVGVPPPRVWESDYSFTQQVIPEGGQTTVCWFRGTPLRYYEINYSSST